MQAYKAIIFLCITSQEFAFEGTEKCHILLLLHQK